LLVRGMLAGLIAGLCAIAFAKIVAEPQIANAENFERQAQIAAGRPLENPLVSRDVQDTIGLGVGVAFAGIALGGLFGLGFAAAYRRLSQVRAKTMALLLAGAAFLAVFLIPFLKYPANPPSVGNPDTIGRRTATYFLLIAVGLLSVAMAVTVRRLATRRLGPWNASLLAVAVLVAIVVVAYLVMPGFNEVPRGFPPTVLWQFRLASAGTQLTLWATLGLVFGELTERRERRDQREAHAAVSV
jgi:predicted cobalt transporter CbtA